MLTQDTINVATHSYNQSINQSIVACWNALQYFYLCGCFSLSASMRALGKRNAVSNLYLRSGVNKLVRFVC